MVSKRKYCIFDTETSGFLSESKAEIVEIGCVLCDPDTFEEVGRFETLIKPENIDLDKPCPSWAKGAFEANNIKFSDLKKAPSGREAVNKLIGFMSCKPHLVGHNIDSFDIPMLKRLFAANDVEFSKIHDSFAFVFDTYPMAFSYWCNDAKMPNLKLGTVAERLGIKIKNTHRALQDVLVNTEVFKKFMLFNSSKALELAKADVKPQPKKDKPKKKIDRTYKCPSCTEGYLQLRKNRSQGNQFYGCSNYPRCKRTCQTYEVNKYKKVESKK